MTIINRVGYQDVILCKEQLRHTTLLLHFNIELLRIYFLLKNLI